MSREPYRIVDVSEWVLDDVGQEGDSRKAWLQDPDGLSWLCKPRPDHPHDGADWVERVSTEAHRELASEVGGEVRVGPMASGS